MHNRASSISNKRKLTDSFIDDDKDENLMITNDGLLSTDEHSKINMKRPRMLDMNKVRSIVLGNNQPSFLMKLSSSTSEKLLEWKTYSTYDEYLTSKKYDQQRFHLPKLTYEDYYTEPLIEELHSYFNEDGQCFVKQFTITRKHYGSITFRGLHMNLAGLDLDRLGKLNFIENLS